MSESQRRKHNVVTTFVFDRSNDIRTTLPDVATKNQLKANTVPAGILLSTYKHAK